VVYAIYRTAIQHENACADDDAKSGNPGLTKAREAAQAVGAIVAVPDFGDDRPKGTTDFNDLLIHAGADAVRASIQADAQTIEGDSSPVCSTVTVSGLLDEAGMTGAPQNVDAAVSSLRLLEELLTKSGADSLVRAGVREEAIARLKTAGLKSPAKLVDAALAISDEGNDTQTVWGEDPEPWSEHVEVADLLNEIVSEISRYLALPDGAAAATALWVVFSHLHDNAPVSPLLTISSPVKRCGKTTLMTLLTELVPRPLPASNVSAAAVFRIVEAWHPTLLVDEADSFLRDREELRGILNSGHTPAMAFVVRCDGDDHEPRRFSTWCGKVLALIGQPPDTLADRSVVIPMRRRAPGEHTDRLRTDRLDLMHLKQMAARWALDHPDVLRDDPAMPESLNDRAADNWRPLLAIADSAGGSWPERARRTAVMLTTGGEDDGATGTVLLGDLKKIFEERDAGRLSSAEIIEALVKMEERPWPEWRRGKPLTQRGLARLLVPFDIRPKQLWAGGKKTRGYGPDDFKDAWARYVVSETGRTGRTRTSSEFQPISQPVGEGEPTDSENSQNPPGDKVLPVLPDANPEPDEWTNV
jgi:putative DNA primase/helicase